MTISTETTTAKQGATADGAAILAGARAAVPILREEADESERIRQLTPRAVQALRSAGAFRMPVPRSWGGPEVDAITQVQVIEELSYADGSAGWCAMIGSAGGYYSAYLDDAAGRALYADVDAVTAGWVVPAGRLETADGGYRLSGRWQFASGCTHADVMLAGAVVLADGEPVTDAAGLPETRVALLRAERFEILDTWHTTGLAGSGSHDYTIDDAFVPAEQTFRWGDRRRDGTLYAWPGTLLVGHLGVPLGIGRAALELAEDLLAGKVVKPEMRLARDEPRVRFAVARAEAIVGSARSYAFDVLGDFWDTLAAGYQPSHRQRGALAGNLFHTVRSCHRAVELLVDAIGTDALFRTCPLERHRRDLATISQHITAQPRLLEVVGGLWLDGADLDHPMLNQRLL